MHGAAEELLYRSNALGLLLGRIASWQRADTEWVVQVEAAGKGEVRRLFDKGVETRRWESVPTAGGRKEKELLGDWLVALRVFDAAGNLLREDQFDGGSITQSRVLVYSGSRLARVKQLDPSGAVVYTDEYLYAVNGGLREVRRSDAASAPQVSSFVAGPAGISEERAVSGDASFVYRFDPAGRITTRVQSRSGTMVSRQDFVYRAGAGLLSSSSERFPAQDRVVDRLYDEAGLLSSEVTHVSGSVTETNTFARDGKGRLIRTTRRGPNGLEQWKYGYGDSGNLATEEYVLRGTLQKVTEYGADRQRTEALYKDGEVFLKTWYNGDVRVKEQVYADGQVIRVRTYP
jgi:hypothetical protein